MTDTENQAVDTPAPDANVQDKPETPEVTNEAESSPATSETEEIAAKAKGVGKRIDELTRLRRDAERERDHWRELAMRQQAPQPEPQKPVSHTPKTLADFEFNEAEYQSYLFEQATAKATEAARRELEAERTRRAQAERKNAFTKRESAFAKDNPDYMEVTRDPRVPISAEMAEAIAESEDGPALAYFLAKNLDEADRLSALSPSAQARELGRIEARLQFERQKAEEAKKRVSQAPPPPPKLDAAEADTDFKPDEPDSDKLSDAEWTRRRNSQEAMRRRNRK